MQTRSFICGEAVTSDKIQFAHVFLKDCTLVLCCQADSAAVWGLGAVSVVTFATWP